MYTYAFVCGERDKQRETNRIGGWQAVRKREGKEVGLMYFRWSEKELKF